MAPGEDRAGPVRKWVSRVSPHWLHQGSWFGVLMSDGACNIVLAVFCLNSNSWFRVPLKVKGGTPKSCTSNAGLMCIYRESRVKGIQFQVINPFKEFEWSLDLPTETYTIQVLSSNKVVAIDGQAQLLMYHDGSSKTPRTIHQFEPADDLQYYQCSAVVGDIVYFLVKDCTSGRYGLLRFNAESETLHPKLKLLVDVVFDEESIPKLGPNLCDCDGKLITVHTEKSDSGAQQEDHDESITGLIISRVDKETGELTELQRMPDELLREMLKQCDSQSRAWVCGRGKYVFIQFVHYVLGSGYLELVERERAVMCDIEFGRWHLTPKKPMKYKQLLHVFALDPAQSLQV